MNLIEEIFAKLEHRLHEAAALAVETICAAITQPSLHLPATNAQTISKNSGYA
jgi:hypothetical protein